MQKILIDGYNLIHAAADLKRVAEKDMQAARRRLLEKLVDYVSAKRIRLTVVFDGSGTMADTEAVVPGKLQTVFTASGETADELILDILQRARNPREYVVVTSDMTDIGRNAVSLGATVLPSPEFYRRIDGSRDKRADGADIADTASQETSEANDVDFWMEQFRKRDDAKDRDGES